MVDARLGAASGRSGDRTWPSQSSRGRLRPLVGPRRASQAVVGRPFAAELAAGRVTTLCGWCPFRLAGSGVPAAGLRLASPGSGFVFAESAWASSRGFRHSDAATTVPSLSEGLVRPLRELLPGGRLVVLGTGGTSPGSDRLLFHVKQWRPPAASAETEPRSRQQALLGSHQEALGDGDAFAAAANYGSVVPTDRLVALALLWTNEWSSKRGACRLLLRLEHRGTALCFGVLPARQM